MIAKNLKNDGRLEAVVSKRRAGLLSQDSGHLENA